MNLIRAVTGASVLLCAATAANAQVVAVATNPQGTLYYSVGAADRPRWLPTTPLVELSLADGSRVLARPSGTEPKVKIYADVRASVGSIAEVPAVRTAALEVAHRLADDLAARMGLA